MDKANIAPGDVIGRWTVLDACEKTEKGETKRLCRCECGTERYVLERSLRSGGSQSCGCLTRERAYEASAYDMLGKTFGELTVVGRSRKRTKLGGYWTCLCSCGYTCEATASELVTGRKRTAAAKPLRITPRRILPDSALGCSWLYIQRKSATRRAMLYGTAAATAAARRMWPITPWSTAIR